MRAEASVQRLKQRYGKPTNQEFLIAVKTVAELLIHELSDTYSAEKQMTRSLPKMARAAADEQLAQAFRDHLEETRGQFGRIN